ncbi:hypothetical protein SISNIDRAFT_198213 [Sistotremastrum niveocremeum HHB9708]|uniref:HIG1 domain-containing protein n=1 Tax=Sistotremastrum niveocremeum HHB9708 TaxID=1314777 RepID=A0A164ZLG5_9AGAM|nr:hypothetical protein SISNIDRAFT_198213 [Sistotremastrum niveocremeum HHB9708]
MKLVTEEQIQAHQRVALWGGVKGFATGLAVALPGSYLLHRRWPYYRQLPISLKVLGVVTLVLPSFAVGAEHASLNYDRAAWTGVGKEEIDAVAQREQDRWNNLKTSEKLSEWATKHQYGIIGGSWAVSMGIASAIVMRDRNQTFAQKIVQARMWAQGLTISVLIAAAVLTHRNRDRLRDVHHPAVPDHSWADVIEISERERAERLKQSAAS